MAGYSTPAWTNDAAPAIDAAALTAMGQGIELSEHPYGVCSTGSSTAAKTVTIDFSGTLVLFAGLTIRVKFSNGNTVTAPTLNVNSTGAIPIKAVTGVEVGYIVPGETLELVYDANANEWRVINGMERQKILWYTGVSVTVANPAAEILRINDAGITTHHVLVELKFSSPTNIKSHLSWTTGNGYFSLSGVCSEATSASFVLGQYMK